MVPDQDLTFYLCTYLDEFLLNGCLSNLRKHYSSRVIVVSDGDGSENIPKICCKHSVEFHMGEWLYGVEHGGRRHHRMLELFFQKPSKYLLKIDTDTRVLRRFTMMPTHFCNFGSTELFDKLDSEFIQGGCIGYPYDVAKNLYDDKVFLDESVAVENWCFNDWCVRKKGRISEDQISTYCTKKIGCEFFQHPEVMSLGPLKAQKAPHRLKGDFAVIHPYPIRKPKSVFDKYLVQVL